MTVDTPLPYQWVGARFLAERRYAGLFDEMGVGKSCEAVLAADLIKACSILVVAPSIALINWSREIVKWSPGATVSIASNDCIKPARFMIVAYDLFSVPGAFLYQMQAARFDLMILDECQALKSHDAARTKNVLSTKGFARQAQRVWAMSGTPCPNHPGELYALLLALYPPPLLLSPDHNGRRAIMSYQSFLNRFCVVVDGPRYNQFKVVGARNMNQLREMLRPFALRRTLKEVLPELPPLRFSTVALDPADVDVEEIETDAEVEALREIIEAACAQDELPAVELATMRRLFGIAKAPLVAAWLQEEIVFSGLDKVVVFFYHREVGERIAGSLRHLGASIIHGDVNKYLRQEIIDNFQTDETRHVLLLQVDIGHTAITLTAAAHVVFAEASWVPSINVQAARRCARLGQTRAVLARFMILAGSLDEIIMRVVARKTAILAQLFPSFEETPDAAEPV